MFESNLYVKQSRNGSGTYCKTDIPANKPIFEATGKIIDITHPQCNENVIQLSDKDYLLTKNGLYLNHSCDPNMSLKIAGNRAIFYSLYLIKKDTELTFDYSTSSTDTKEMWSMKCNCGSVVCRKEISGIQYLSDDLINKYKEKGMIPLFLRK